jgi:hypothetical protein
MDNITLTMFAIPMAVAILFTLLSYMELKKDKATVNGLMSSLIASITWFLFSLLWASSTTTDMFLSVAYLWSIFGVIFAVITLYTGLKMMGAIFQTKSKPMLTMEEDNSE